MMAKSKSPKPESKPDDKDERETCFIMMPFHEPFFFFCHAIFAPAADDADLRITRTDDEFTSREIVADMWKKIQEAKVCLAVLTEANANVFYELGLAHALSKPVVLISDKEESIPFDLRAYRTALYDPNQDRWWEELRKTLTIYLQQTLANPVDAVPTMFREKVHAERPTENELSSRLGQIERNIGLLQSSIMWGSTDWKTSGTRVTVEPVAAAQMRLEKLLGGPYPPGIPVPQRPVLTKCITTLLREDHSQNCIMAALLGYVDFDTAIQILKRARKQVQLERAMTLKDDTSEKPPDSDA